VRALDRLRDGVQKAIEVLGTGLLRHEANENLHAALADGTLDEQVYYRMLLRLVYRLLFLLVAEDRGAPIDPNAPGSARLRQLADGRHGNPWHELLLLVRKLDAGSAELGLPALGSFLCKPGAAGLLGESKLSREDLQQALHALCYVEHGKARHAVDFRDIGPEALGSVYESLLELHPKIHGEPPTFALSTAAGHERKTTGSYYTPRPLVECLLDSALSPVLDEAAAKGEKAILALKVCDPACGSGHFLVAAARRIAMRLSAVRSGGDEPSPDAVRRALRDVVGQCIYGVDLNPMAVELCKVSLWMEAIEPGRPPSFLEAHIRQGNALLGATPALMERGIPDEAFEAIEGDDKEVARALKRRNKRARRGQTSKAILVHEDAWFLADAWCAAFVWPKEKGPKAEAAITEDRWQQMVAAPGSTPETTRQEVQRIAEGASFFHWHLAFPEVFCARGGGFDVVLGNPPWENVELKEAEWFATRRPEIAAAANANARKKMIGRLRQEAPLLHARYQAELRSFEAAVHLSRASNRYPLCARGRVNTYALFAELSLGLLSRNGRMGMIVPTGIATDDGTKDFFQCIMRENRLVSLFDFENVSGARLFPGVGHGRFKLCVLTVRGDAGRDPPTFAFYAHAMADIAHPDRRFSLTMADIAALNPNTRTCPTFRSARDASLNKAIYRRAGIWVRDGAPDGNPWGVSFMQGLFNMASDSGLFRSAQALRARGLRLRGNVFFHEDGRCFLPLLEAKMMHQLDHRYGDYEDMPSGSENTSLPEVPRDRLLDPFYAPMPRYWVEASEIDGPCAGRWERGWFLSFRDICRSTDERTVIATIVPRVAIGHTMPLILGARLGGYAASMLVANMAAFVFDYCARQKIGGTHLTFGLIKQLPVLSPGRYETAASWSGDETVGAWLLPRVLELVYTAWDLESFARDAGYDGPPFRWDAQRRFLLRCEIDAAFFHLYGIAREDVDYIMETFPIVRRDDVAAHGEYRTKLRILDVYDRMRRAIDGGEPYRTLLDPLPADRRVAHPPRGGKS
jgi:hypothetical protein